MSIHKVSTNIFPTTYPLDFIKGDQNAYDPNWYIFAGCFVWYFKGEEDMNHSQTVTSVCNVFSLDYTFFATRRLVCYISHYGAFF